ncbi:hypothetical protein KM043_002104 [Ampulex compressa]|nr:hypothetical protein KM043_002104 [Ampulex compressa]
MVCSVNAAEGRRDEEEEEEEEVEEEVWEEKGVAVYPRGHCSRHVQPASPLDCPPPTAVPLELSTTLTAKPVLTYKM